MPNPVRPFTPRRQAGLSLVELLLVLAGFAVMLLLVLVGNEGRTAHSQALQAGDAVTAVMGASQEVTTNQQDFTGLTMSDVAQMRNMPSILGKGPVFHVPWGGVFTLGASSSSVDTDDLVSVTLTKVPQRQCQDMATTLSPSLYDTTVNGKVVALTPAPTTQMPGRTNVDFSKLQTLCLATDNNTMVFRQMKTLDATLFVHPDDFDRQVFVLNTELAAQRQRRAAAIQAREAVQSGL
jgi:Tfp pilus assembly protein FimT